MFNLQNAKIGDVVFYNSGSYENNYHLTKVNRITKTQIACEDGSKFMKSSGLKIGTSNSYRAIYGYIADEDKIKKVKMWHRVNAAQKEIKDLWITEDNIDLTEKFLQDLKT
jgi:hypothetical protein